jgi:hypothetical protein
VKSRTAQQWAVIASALIAYLRFAMMDSFPDYSTPQDVLQIAGYALCGLTLFLFYKVMSNRPA